MPISAFIFGGRLSNTFPLVYQSLDWNHGVYMAATMGSEATAAADNQAAIRRDPMAMLPFCGYNMGDYWAHWLSMADKLQHLPMIFRTNWFRKDSDGKFMWPGFGQNMRALNWVVDRVNDRGNAVEHPLGLVPEYNDLNWAGLEYSEEEFNELMSINTDTGIAEIEDQKNQFDKFGDKLPAEMEAQRQRALERVKAG